MSAFVKALKYVQKLVSWVFTAIGVFFLIFFPMKFLAWIEFQDRTPAAPAELVERSEEFWTAAAANAGINGYLRIIEGDKVLISKAFGQDHADENTKYQIGSLSKQFTSALIFQLEMNGKLRRSDAVCTHLETFCQSELRAVTIDHLLTHTAGLSIFPLSLSGFFWIYTQFFKAYELQDLVSMQANVLMSKPGTEYQYSNFGYDVLAAIIEKNSAQKSFRLAMDDYFKSVPKLANTHIAESIYKSAFGSGAVVSTPFDMTEWGKRLLDGKVFPESVRSEYWRPNLEEYAKGWIVDKHKVSGETVVWHNGKITGYFSSMAIYPESGRIVVWLSNTDISRKEDRRLIKEFDRILFGKPYAVPSASRTIPHLYF